VPDSGQTQILLANRLLHERWVALRANDQRQIRARVLLARRVNRWFGHSVAERVHAFVDDDDRRLSIRDRPSGGPDVPVLRLIVAASSGMRRISSRWPTADAPGIVRARQRLVDDNDKRRTVAVAVVQDPARKKTKTDSLEVRGTYHLETAERPDAEIGPWPRPTNLKPRQVRGTLCRQRISKRHIARPWQRPNAPRDLVEMSVERHSGFEPPVWCRDLCREYIRRRKARLDACAQRDESANER
jgi:hypothetical protein